MSSLAFQCHVYRPAALAAVRVGDADLAGGHRQVGCFVENVYKLLFHFVTQMILIHPVSQNQKLIDDHIVGLPMDHKVLQEVQGR